MSGIDNLVKKLERVPRSVFDPIRVEYEEKLRQDRENEEVEKQARILKEAEDKRLAKEQFINGELNLIMQALEYQFNTHKARLMKKEFPYSTFGFEYRSPKHYIDADLWQIVVDKAKTAIKAIVIADDFSWRHNELSVIVTLVDPVESTPISTAQQSQ
jgi:hypothetical protein